LWVLDLGLGGAEVLQVAAGATATATLGAAWIATPESFNDGIANLFSPGVRVDLSEVGGTGARSVSNARGDRGGTFIGSRNNDVLTGGSADDILTGGLGDDVMAGGLSGDRFVVDAGTDRITDLGLGGVDQLAVAAGATANASLAASWVASRASSNDGVANLRALGFDVDLSQGLGSTGWNLSNSGNTTWVTLVGSGRADVLTGGTGDDVLRGGAGDDRLLGGVGDDTLAGGLGADRQTGGAGADVFVSDSVVEAQGDMITDFSAAQGDMIDLRGIDTSPAAGDQGFTYLGGAAFAVGVTGQLRFAGGVLEGDVNGDGVADFQVQMTAGATLAASSIGL